ncbi:MAG: ATP-binding protein [Pseudomonadota bacterium]
MTKIPNISRRIARSAKQWFFLILLLSTATICAYLLDPYVSITSQAMLYVLAVVIASYTLGWGMSVLCAVAAVMALNFFFVLPRWTFQIERSEHFIALMTMLVVALVINRLATGLRRETETAHLNERRARQLQDLAIALADAHTEQDVLALAQHALDAEFSGPCLVVLGAAQGQENEENELTIDDRLPSSIIDGLRCCMKEARVLGPGTERWPGLDAWYLPVGAKGQICGAVYIPSVAADDDYGREHARALCTILAQALWRLRLTKSMLAAEGEAQRQQLQSIFLAAISHDLRTPLAVVVGAASSLQTQRDKLDLAEQDRLLTSIVSEANYLTTVTENTLQLVRLSNSAKLIEHDWESIEEIVGAVLARVRQRDPGRRIISKVPNNLPLVRVDPVLIAQLIGNLLDNALKYSDEKIDLTVDVVSAGADQQLQLSIKDRGPGIPEAEQHSIFEAYSRMDHNDQSTQRGAGLGLAVCRAIALAHGGSLVLQQRVGGGSKFTLSLPVDSAQPLALGAA